MADPARHFAQMFSVAAPSGDALLMFFYWGTWINVMAWGIAYAAAALVPESRVAVLVAGSLGKAAYFAAAAALVASGVGRPLLLAFGIGDLAMAVLFAWALLSMMRPVHIAAWSVR
jgi:hypothetical protein